MASEVQELLIKYSSDISPLVAQGEQLANEFRKMTTSAEVSSKAVEQSLNKQAAIIDSVIKRLGQLATARDNSQGDPARIERINALIAAQQERLNELKNTPPLELIDPANIQVAQQAIESMKALTVAAKEATTDPDKIKILNQLLAEQEGQLRRLATVPKSELVEQKQIGLLESAKIRLQELAAARDQATDPAKVAVFNSLIAEQVAEIKKLTDLPAVTVIEPEQVGLIEQAKTSLQELKAARDASNDTEKIALLNQLIGEQEAELKKLTAIPPIELLQPQQLGILEQARASLQELTTAREKADNPEKIQEFNTLIAEQEEAIRKLTELPPVTIIAPEQLGIIQQARASLDELTKARDESTDPEKVLLLNQLIAEQNSELQKLTTIPPAKIVDPAQIGLIENVRNRLAALTAARDKSNDPTKIARLNTLIEQQQQRVNSLTNATQKQTGVFANLFNKINVKPLSEQFAELGKGIVAAFAVQQVIAFGKESVTAFAQAEKTAKLLETTIVTIGGGTDSDFQEFIQQAEEVQDTSIFSKGQIENAQIFAAQFGLTKDQIKDLIPVVADFASATGQDFQEALQKITQGLSGNGRALKQYGIEVSNTGNKATDLANITEQLNKKFEGQAEVVRSTTSGALQVFSNKMEDIKESVGEGLVNAFNGIVGGIDLLTGGFLGLTPEVENAQDSFDALSKSTGISREEFEKFTVAISNANFKNLKLQLDNLNNLDASAEALKSVGERLQGVQDAADRSNLSKLSNTELLDVARALDIAINKTKQLTPEISKAQDALAKTIKDGLSPDEIKKAQENLDQVIKDAPLQKITKDQLDLMKKFNITVVGDQALASKKTLDIFKDELEKRGLALQGYTKSIEVLEQQKSELEAKLKKVDFGTAGGQKEATDIRARIKQIQDIIDEISGKAADDAAKKEADRQKKILDAKKAASEKLLELDKKINDDLLKAKGQNAIELLQAEKKIAEEELRVTFDKSEQTLEDKKNLNDALLKLTQEFNIKERDLIFKQEKDKAKAREDAANDEIEQAKTRFEATKTNIDSQEKIEIINVRQKFSEEGDFSPAALEKKEKEIFEIEQRFNDKRLEEQKKFADEFIRLNNAIFLSKQATAQLDSNKVEADLFANVNPVTGLPDPARAQKAKDDIIKISTDLANEQKKLGIDAANVLNDVQDQQTENLLFNLEEQERIRQQAFEKQKQLEDQIRDTVVNGVQELIIEASRTASEQRIADIEAVRDAELEAIDTALAANEEGRKRDSISRKDYEDTNRRLLGERAKAEEEADAKIKAIKRKQFQNDQIAAISKIAIAALVAAAEAGFNPALDALYASLALVEIGLVLARPNPYAKGTKHSKRGLSMVGEEGVELMNLPEGAQVLPHGKTKKKQNAEIIDAMFDDRLDSHVRKVFVEPALKEQAEKFLRTGEFKQPASKLLMGVVVDKKENTVEETIKNLISRINVDREVNHNVYSKISTDEISERVSRSIVKVLNEANLNKSDALTVEKVNHVIQRQFNYKAQTFIERESEIKNKLKYSVEKLSEAHQENKSLLNHIQSRVFSFSDYTDSLTKYPKGAENGKPVFQEVKRLNIDIFKSVYEKGIEENLSKMRVAEKLVSGVNKYNQKQQEIFANNIANSFMLQNIGLDAGQLKKINKKGMPVTNSMQLAKQMAKELEKLKPFETKRRYS